MNSEQVKGLIRAALVALFGGGVGVWLAKHGITVDDSFINMAAAVVSGAVAILWSMFAKTQAATVSKAAAIVNVPATEQAKVGITEPVKPS